LIELITCSTIKAVK
jgi:adenylate cyclase 1